MSTEATTPRLTDQQCEWVLERAHGLAAALVAAGPGADEEAVLSRHIEDVTQAFRVEFGEDPPISALLVTLAVGHVAGRTVTA
jgi:hypothetical protein